ncbi:MAG: NAD(P)-dependent oxidoreductase, partial [Hyphomicrobiales bacterium]
DTAMGLLLMTVRELGKAERYLRAGSWLEKPYPLTPASLTNRSMGIFGLGRVGKAIAKRAEAFGMPISYCGRTCQNVPWRHYADLAEMARDVDVLMAAAPGGAETRHAVNADVLAALGADGILVNVGRGSLVDTDALIEALASRTILAAGLDVYEDEPRVPARLVALDNAVLLPHVGSASIPTREAMARLTRDNLLSWFREGRALTAV